LSDVNEDRIVLSTAGEKGLPAILVADRENVAMLLGARTIDGAVHVHILFEKLETLDANAKALLLEALQKAAEFVAGMNSEACLPQCRHIRATPTARLWGSFRRLTGNRQHILKQAAKLRLGLVVAARTIVKTRIEVIFEEGRLNANGKARLVEGLRRAAHVVELRGGSRASGVA